jgi:AcrR family transcriptional regulator
MTQPRRQLEADTRRRFILEQARLLFARNGVENTSMQEIAVAADYTRRTVYTYFKSADEIRLLVFTEDLKARWALQQAKAATVTTGREKLTAWAEVLYDFCKSHPDALTLQAYWDYRGVDRKHLSREAFKAFAAVNDELADGLRDIFNLGVRDGSIRPDLPVDISISHFLHSLRSVIHRGLTTTYSFAEFDPDEYVRSFIDLFAHAIHNPEGHTT